MRIVPADEGGTGGPLAAETHVAVIAGRDVAADRKVMTEIAQGRRRDHAHPPDKGMRTKKRGTAPSDGSAFLRFFMPVFPLVPHAHKSVARAPGVRREHERRATPSNRHSRESAVMSKKFQEHP